MGIRDPVPMANGPVVFLQSVAKVVATQYTRLRFCWSLYGRGNRRRGARRERGALGVAARGRGGPPRLGRRARGAGRRRRGGLRGPRSRSVVVRTDIYNRLKRRSRHP